MAKDLDREYDIKWGHALGFQAGLKAPCPKCGYVHNCKMVDRLTVGLLFRLTSFWVGVHYSKREKRICINVVPGVTVWIALPGGQRP